MCAHKSVLAVAIARTPATLVRMLTVTIRDAMKSAMKARDDLRVQTLRGALAAFTNELVAKGRKPTDQLSDPEAVVVLKRLAKQRKEAADQYVRGERGELADKELRELSIIETYLPAMLSREEIEKVARVKKEELGILDQSGAGKLTGAVMKALGGRADGTDVKAVVSSLLLHVG